MYFLKFLWLSLLISKSTRTDITSKWAVWWNRHVFLMILYHYHF